MSDAADSAPRKSSGLIGSTLSLIATFIGWVVVAIFASIVIELAGMFFGLWSSDHAMQLLRKERSYIENIEAFPFIALSPVQVSDLAITRVTDVTEPIARLEQENRMSSAVWAAVASMLNVIKLITLRLIVSLMSLPGYVLVGMAAAIDGLVARDVRKFTGGHESGWVFHRAKRLVTPSIVGSISLYLLLPWSVPPALIFAPSMLLFAFMLYLTASKFKKYL